MYSLKLIILFIFSTLDKTYRKKSLKIRSNTVEDIPQFYVLTRFAGRATFLSPMVHRQSDIFVFFAVAQCKAFSYWLHID